MEPDRPSTGPRVPGYLGDMTAAAQPPRWPDIADYWPDARQRMGPAADVNEDPAAEPTRIGPLLHEQVLRTAQPRGAGPDRRRRVRTLVVAAIAAVLLLAGGAMAYGKMADRKVTAAPEPTVTVTVPAPPPSSPAPAVVEPGPSSSPSARPSISASPTAAALGSGSLQVVDDVTELSLTSARVDGGIARVGVPDGSNATPRASTKGNAIRLSVGTRGRGTKRLIVQLDNRLSWAIRLGGHARHMTVSIGGGVAVRNLTFDGTANEIDLTLARLSRTLPIQLTGGVNQWRIGTEGKIAVDVLAKQGAGKVVLYGQDRGALKPGKTARVSGSSGLDIDATAGFGTLTVSSA